MNEPTGQSAVWGDRQSLELDIAKKLEADPGFRQALLADSRAAIQSAFGIAIPAKVAIHIYEYSPAELHICLPPTAEELSDQALGAAAGGRAPLRRR